MERVLIIDDDENLVELLQIALQAEGFEVLTAVDGQDGLRAAFDSHPDLILLDIMMPRMDGLETARRLEELCDTPIILLTALSATSDIVKGLEIGADDYVTKPFVMEELIARIRNSLRRKAAVASNARTGVLVLGNLTIDLVRHKVTAYGKPVNLTPTEFRLLSHLARHTGQVIPHQALLTEVWGAEYCDQIDYLHLYVRYLRQKIELDPAEPGIIKTERGVGYYLEEPRNKV
jgi:DNA-binding response OmpR family regulator